MATRVPQLPYVYWLIDQETVGYFSYENRRRRLTNYSILLDDTRTVGYEIRNPLTGYNYAYHLRVKKKFADQVEEAQNYSFKLGLGLSTSSFAYLWGVRGRYVALMALLNGVFVTELLGYLMSNQMLGTTSQQELHSLLVAIRNVGPSHEFYKHLEALVNRLEPHQDINGDLEWVAGAYWNEKKNDNIQGLQGISIVTATVSAAAIFSHWFRNGYKRGWGWWLLAGAAHYNLYNNLELYVNDTGAGDTTMAVGHSLHAMQPVGCMDRLLGNARPV